MQITTDGKKDKLTAAALAGVIICNDGDLTLSLTLFILPNETEPAVFEIQYAALYNIPFIKPNCLYYI